MKGLVRYIPVLLCLLVLPGLRQESPGLFRFDPVSPENLHNSMITVSESGKHIYTVSDMTTGKTDRFTHEMVLSFNSPTVSSDDTGKYRVLKSDYVFDTKRGSLGGGCAEFYKSEHVLEIDPGERLWLSKVDDLGSFSIEFRVCPIDLDDGIIFSRTGFFSGEKQGIEIALKDSRIEARFINMFHTPDGQRKSILLNRGRPVSKKEWTHYAVSFDCNTGALVSYINGREDEFVYITTTEDSYGKVYTPAFGIMTGNRVWQSPDLPSVVIGKNFIGLLDEFRISCLPFVNIQKKYGGLQKPYRGVSNAGRLPMNVEGVVVSPVYSFDDTGTKVTLFDWEEKKNKDSFVWMEFRISDNLFYENDSDLKWYRIRNGQQGIYLQKNDKGNFLRGKYFQWRMHLVASPDGQHSPSVSEMRLFYMRDTAPEVPSFVDIAETGDGFVKLRWKKNVDHDILGYKIYYGYSPERNDGVLSYLSGKRISNSLSKGNFIEITIDNSLINENRKKDYVKFNDYPLLRNTVLYYFSVSAYDSYRPDSSHNHESGLSKRVSARPYAGSEILTTN